MFSPRLAVLALVILAPACGADDGPGPGGPVEGDSTYLLVNRIRDPSGRTNFVSVFPDLEPRMASLEASLEVPGASRFRVFDGRLYTFQGESAQVVRYAVDDRGTFVEEGRFSMANLGVGRFFSQGIAFVSPTRAYYVDPVQAQLVVWSPSAMEILGTQPVPGLSREGFAITNVGASRVVDRWVVTPLAFRTQTQDEVLPAAAMLVVAAADETDHRVLEDGRCWVSTTGFLADGAYYLLGDFDGGVYAVYNPEAVPPPCLLRWTPGAERFDAQAVDLPALTGFPHFAGAFGVGGGPRFIVRLYGADTPPSEIPALYPNPSAYFGLELWRWGLVDLTDGTTTALDGLPLSGISFNPSTVDGASYVPVIDEDTQRSTLFAVSGDGQTRESLRADGDILGVFRLR